MPGTGEKSIEGIIVCHLWNKRAVSSGQTEESYKEQLQSLKQTVNNLGLVSEQFEGAAEGLTESSDKVGHGVQVLAEGASRQERDVLQCRKIAEEFTAKITDMDQETATMQTQVQQMQQQSDLGRQRVEHLGKTQAKTQRFHGYDHRRDSYASGSKMQRLNLSQVFSIVLPSRRICCL